MPEPGVKPAGEDAEEERRETGTSLILIGWLCWIFAALVMFFNPSAIRLGRLTMVEIAVTLAVAGLVLNILGLRVRKRKNSE
ncbi:MAG TPA: hypothetical protein VN622_09555 [Clostridia bacterium]|nr:hypothetical protein [Clostridia bacterium]